VKLLKSAGASKVHVRISCPEVLEPCYYGVDFPEKAELIAGREEIDHPGQDYVETIRQIIGADTLAYQTMDGLVRAIGLPQESLCLACLNGDYPFRHEETARLFGRGRI
jgi:amidophosphoribosyltransferase